ncbi:hypothetical protein ABPG72_003148 [Tetrahymena utriculariae]
MGFNLRLATKIAVVCCGILMIIVSIVSFATDTLYPINAILDIYYIFFSISLICSEWEIVYVIDNFKLLASFFGKGIFCIFLGTILLDDSSSKASSVLSLTVGIILIVVGLAYEVLACTVKNKDKSGASAAQNAAQGNNEKEQENIQNNV